MITGDGCGGCFYLWHAEQRGDQVPVVYLSSYGEASRFAKDFTAALTIVVAFPGYWGDVLVAACKGGDRVGRGTQWILTQKETRTYCPKVDRKFSNRNSERRSNSARGSNLGRGRSLSVIHNQCAGRANECGQGG